MSACPFCADRAPMGYPRFPATPCLPCNRAYQADLLLTLPRAEAARRVRMRLVWLGVRWPEVLVAVREQLQTDWAAFLRLERGEGQNEGCEAAGEAVVAMEGVA